MADYVEYSTLKPENNIHRTPHFHRQVLGSSGPVLLTFTVGLTFGFSTTLVPQLALANTIPHDESTVSWIASMAVLPMAPGCLLSGWLMTRFGRKNSLHIVGVAFIVGWLCISFANCLSLLLIGRFITGLCVGIVSPLTPVYMGETSHPKYRAFFIATLPLAYASGILVVHATGTYLTWRLTAGLCCIFPVSSLFLLSLLPESPTWLVYKGRTQEAADAFTWLRGDNKKAKEELTEMIDKHRINAQSAFSLEDILLYLKKPELLRPLSVMTVLFLTSQFSGMNAAVFYCIQIVSKAIGDKSNVDLYLMTIVIDVFRVLTSAVACVVCKSCGRRPLCFLSGLTASASMMGLSLFSYFFKETENLSWIPLPLLSIYICAVSVGLMPLPWIMCGEVFPARFKGFGTGFSSALSFVACFVVVKMYPGMMGSFGEVITFAVYGTITGVGTTALYFILPETKGDSLQEIEDKFVNGKQEIM